MRLTIFFLITSTLSLLATGSYSQNTRVSLDLKSVSVKDALRAIENTSEFFFIYNNELIDVNRKIDINVKDQKISDVLNNIFSSKDVEITVVDRKIILSPASMGEQQGKKVTGKVTDQTGASLPGVSVVVKGSTTGVITDNNGNYSLANISENSILQFSFVGMKTQEVKSGNQSIINVVLVEQAIGLEEVVAIGYGTVKKSDIIGTISSVKQDELTNVSSSRVDQALQGRTSGVRILPSSGSPGSSMSVRIRGAGSNGNSEPLYIVDGIRVGGIDYLDPSEIASIEVLKDAASAAIYGASAANGVINITTKTGKKDHTEISYSGQYGIQSVGHLLSSMNTQEYVKYMEEAGTPGILPTSAEAANLPTTNWMREIIQSAPMQKHSLNISGGTEKSTYLIGGTAYKQDGIVGGNTASFDRYTLRINSDHKIKKWLNIGNRISLSFTNRKSVGDDSEYGGLINSALLMDPITPVRYQSTLPAFVQKLKDDGKSLVTDQNGNIYGMTPYFISDIANPLAKLSLFRGKSNVSQLIGNIYADIMPFEGLVITTRFNADISYSRSHNWNPSYYFNGQNLNSSASVNDNYSNGSSLQLESFATYKNKIEKHNFSLMAGASAIKNIYTGLSANSTGLFKEQDKFAYQDYTQNDLRHTGGSIGQSQLASYFGRFSYDYDGRYLFNSTVRFDGSSLLPPGHYWGTFPSLSAGWRISNEKFFAVKAINDLKLRASWGRNGNLSSLSQGQWAATITSQNLRYPDSNDNFLIAAEPTVLPNYDLRWESSEQFDLGLDMGLLNNKLTLSVDYFNKMTKDLLTPGTPPNFVGFALPTVNGGNVRNRGFELELGYKNFDRVFKYEISANISTSKNVTTYLNPNYNRIDGTGIGTYWHPATAFQVGYPLWYFLGYKTDGIFQNQAQIDKYIADNGLSGYEPKPGDPIIVNVLKDGIISPADQTMIGSPYPDFTFGFRANFNYAGFDLLIFGQGQVGNKILMGFNRMDPANSNKPEFFYTNRWTGEGSTNKWFSANTTNPFVYESDFMIFDGSYARIKQLQLGYTLPKKIVSNINISALRIYISLDDFFTITKYPGTDPEAGSNDQRSLGIDRGAYPISRKILLGVNVTF